MSPTWRLAIVVPPHAIEPVAGTEDEVRWAAAWLARRHDVTVVTTGGDRTPAGSLDERERHGGVRVRRFSAPALLEHLDREGAGYDAVIFAPYLCETTLKGLPLVADRSLLIPSLHPAPAATSPIVRRTFRLARGLAFGTPEERDLCRARFGPLRAESRLIGIGAGVPLPPPSPPDGDPYVLHLGRIDAAAGCADLIAHHRVARRVDLGTPRLVLAGYVAMDLPDASWLDVPGPVAGAERSRLISGAVAVVRAACGEGISATVLEAWMHSRPVVVSARAPFLVGEVRRAAGGLWYADAEEYTDVIADLVANPLRATRLGTQGRRYARGRFRPEAVGRRLEELVATVVAPRRGST